MEIEVVFGNRWKTHQKRRQMIFGLEQGVKNSDCVSIFIMNEGKIHQESTKYVNFFRFCFQIIQSIESKKLQGPWF